ncbi:YidB family protein [Acidiphilium iwatense]|uniref:YidB family protein n=2 Tax=Acidiphilium iwatense TaxID=768198 RepID=A0ABS9DZQ7_9PROT|nr:YidB family protein [Acidiphilium iwatense]MCF3947630.1 YidB family protein [Acidiphilium iwatense]
MGLFDQVSGMVSGALGGGSGGVAGQLMGVLQQNGISGVSGLVQQFEQNGLGAHVASWVGSGENLPISADQVQQVLGSPVIASIAQKFGVDPQTAAQLIAQHLPAAVDQATPGGAVADAS